MQAEQLCVQVLEEINDLLFCWKAEDSVGIYQLWLNHEHFSKKSESRICHPLYRPEPTKGPGEAESMSLQIKGTRQKPFLLVHRHKHGSLYFKVCTCYWCHWLRWKALWNTYTKQHAYRHLEFSWWFCVLRMDYMPGFRWPSRDSSIKYVFLYTLLVVRGKNIVTTLGGDPWV